MPVVLVFVVVTLTWIPFRAATFGVAGDVLAGLFRLDGAGIPTAPIIVGLLGLMTVVIDRFDIRGIANPVATLSRMRQGLVYGLAATAGVLFASQSSIPFIYFQF